MRRGFAVVMVVLLLAALGSTVYASEENKVNNISWQDPV